MDNRKKSLGRDFFIMAKGGSPKAKSGQDQSAAAKRARRKAREAARKSQGKSRYSETN